MDVMNASVLFPSTTILVVSVSVSVDATVAFLINLGSGLIILLADVFVSIYPNAMNSPIGTRKHASANASQKHVFQVSSKILKHASA